jgi:sRNA-binding protein
MRNLSDFFARLDLSGANFIFLKEKDAGIATRQLKQKQKRKLVETVQAHSRVGRARKGILGEKNPPRTERKHSCSSQPATAIFIN